MSHVSVNISFSVNFKIVKSYELNFKLHVKCYYSQMSV